MNKRKLILSISGIVLLVVAIFISSRLANSERELPGEEKSNSKVVVNTITVKNGKVQTYLPITGRVMSADRIDIFAEVSGVSSYGSHPFKAGNRFQKGQVLLRIDSEEFSRSLASAKSQFMSLLASVLPDLKIDFKDAYPAWRDYLNNMDVQKSLAELPEVEDEQLKFFLTGRNIYSTYYNILESESRLNKYVIRAPFSGTLTETYINQSALVRTGQQLGEFIRDGAYELESSVTFNNLSGMEIGDEVEFRVVNGSQSFTGKLARINDKVDPESQLVKVYFSMSDPELKSGMYLEGNLPAQAFEQAVELPTEILLDDSSIFVVNNGKAEKTTVDILYQSSKNIVVSNLKDGQVVISDKKNSAFEGTEVEAL